MNDLIAGYGQAIQQLQGVSRGRYPGPAVREAALERAFTAIEGLDTGELRTGARRAAGETRTAGVMGWLGPVLKFLGNVATGMLSSELMGRVQDWVDNRGEAEEVADAADRAADAIDVTVRESDDGIAAILAQLAEITAQISAHLATIDPEKQPEVFMTTVQAGADIIDDAAAMILGLCADRDQAIRNCYGALIEHGRRVCERPDPDLAPAVTQPAGAGAGAGAGGSGGAGVGAGPGQVPSPVEAPGTSSLTAPASASASVGSSGDEPRGPAHTSPAARAEDNCDDARGRTRDEAPEDNKNGPKQGIGECEADQPVAEPVDCESATDPATDPVTDPVTDPAEGSHDTLLGVLGAGLLVIGVGVIVDFLEQAVQDMMAGLAPEAPAETPADPDPDPVAAEPAPPVEPAPQAEPVVPRTPEAELHLVPEPAPKPQPAQVQVAATGGGEQVTQPSGPPPAAPGAVASGTGAPVPGVTVHEAAHEVASPPEPRARIHKAGGW